jgi:hypothetical protein
MVTFPFQDHHHGVDDHDGHYYRENLHCLQVRRY